MLLGSISCWGTQAASAVQSRCHLRDAPKGINTLISQILTAASVPAFITRSLQAKLAGLVRGSDNACVSVRSESTL